MAQGDARGGSEGERCEWRRQPAALHCTSESVTTSDYLVTTNNKNMRQAG